MFPWEHSEARNNLNKAIQYIMMIFISLAHTVLKFLMKQSIEYHQLDVSALSLLIGTEFILHFLLLKSVTLMLFEHSKYQLEGTNCTSEQLWLPTQALSMMRHQVNFT